MITLKMKKVFSTCLLAAALVAMTGCSKPNTSKGTQEVVSAESIVNQQSDEENSTSSDTVNTPEEEVKDEMPMMELSEGIKGEKSEKVRLEELRNFIISYYEIPQEYYETTRYYYNHVDLDDDGEEELFVVVIGPYTSGTGGSSALWVTTNEGKLHVKQDFMIINTPIIVSDNLTNGVHDLIVPYYGGGAQSQYSVLEFKKDSYPRVSDGKMCKDLEGVTGTAIIANDLGEEINQGIMGMNLLGE